MVSEKWYYVKAGKGKLVGPLMRTEIRQLVESGELVETDHLFKKQVVGFWDQIGNRIVAAVLHFVMAGMFLVVWIWPSVLSEGMFHQLVFFMLVEFVIIVFTGLLAGVTRDTVNRPREAWRFILPFLVYIVFVIPIALLGGGPWLLLAVTLSMLGKVRRLFFAGAAKGRAEATAVMTALGNPLIVYALAASIALCLPVPRFGITPEVTQEASGLATNAKDIIEAAHHYIAFGFLYFTTMGLWEFLGFSPGGVAVGIQDVLADD